MVAMIDETRGSRIRKELAEMVAQYTVACMCGADPIGYCAIGRMSRLPVRNTIRIMRIITR